MSQNENGFLKFSCEELGMPKCTRYPFSKLLEKAYSCLKEDIIDNENFSSDNFTQMIFLVYGFRSEFKDNYYNIDFCRIGRLSMQLTKQIYAFAISKQTREAKMEYVRIN